jgi:hypothetical protein
MDTKPAPSRSHIRLALLARTRFVTTFASALISIAPLLAPRLAAR